MSPDDVALADDLRRRGVPEDEIASILGLNQRALALDELR
jgi:predicted transcriptional regulator